MGDAADELNGENGFFEEYEEDIEEDPFFED